MIRVINQAGVDLMVTPPNPAVVTIPNAAADSLVRLDGTIFQTDPLAFNHLSATVNWNDGSLPVVYNGSGTVVVDASRKLRAGNYFIGLTASNYEVPPQTVTVTFAVQVTVANGIAEASPLLYGPILPKDTGFPNAAQWNFDTGTDLEIIASSLKMLLTTAKGERIMLPEYGTNLRLIIFEFKTPGIVAMCQQEITDALAKWEPRASLDLLTVGQTGDREVTINALFTGKLNRQQFSLSLPFAL